MIKICQNVQEDHSSLLTTSLSSNFYPSIKCLLTILVTMSVTTITTRVFLLNVKKLQTYLRNNKGRNRLTRLALMNIFYGNDNIDIDKVINRFA